MGKSQAHHFDGVAIPFLCQPVGNVFGECGGATAGDYGQPVT
jgi:hypothetical protein